jgi:uncharacterized membrane protein YeiH
VERGPAGSGVFEATIRSATERLGGALLRDVLRKHSVMIFRRNPALCIAAGFLPSAHFVRSGRMTGERGKALSAATERIF